MIVFGHDSIVSRSSSVREPDGRQNDRTVRRRAQAPPNPTDPPATTNRHTVVHLLSDSSSVRHAKEDDEKAVGAGAHARHEYVDLSEMPRRAALAAGILAALGSG